MWTAPPTGAIHIQFVATGGGADWIRFVLLLWEGQVVKRVNECSAVAAIVSTMIMPGDTSQEAGTAVPYILSILGLWDGAS